MASRTFAGNQQKKRLTAHRGRVKRNKATKTVTAYNPAHNPHKGFEAEHINPELTAENEVILFDEAGGSVSLNGDEVTSGTIIEHELSFYEKHFTRQVEKQNERNDAAGHSERNKSLMGFYRSPRTAPEEIHFQVGSMREGTIVDKATQRAVIMDWIKWCRQTYPQCVFLDASAHYDEGKAGTHWHIRDCYISHDSDGDEIEYQCGALQDMGFTLPNPNKKRGQFNNEKMPYTQVTREKLIEICKEHGLSIEEVPKEASKSGLDLLEHKAEIEREKLNALQEQQQKTLEDIEKLTASVQEHIKPERKGLFQKTDNFVMDRQQYEQVCEALEEIRTYSRKATENGTATAEARKQAEEARQQADISRQKEQERIQEQALEMVKQLEKQTIRERNKAKKEREAAEADRIQAEGELEAAKTARVNADSIIRERVEEALTERLEELNKDGYVKELRAALKVHRNPLTGENALAEFEREKKERLLEGMPEVPEKSKTRSKTHGKDDYSRG